MDHQKRHHIRFCQTRGIGGPLALPISQDLVASSHSSALFALLHSLASLPTSLLRLGRAVRRLARPPRKQGTLRAIGMIARTGIGLQLALAASSASPVSSATLVPILPTHRAQISTDVTRTLTSGIMPPPSETPTSTRTPTITPTPTPTRPTATRPPTGTPDCGLAWRVVDSPNANLAHINVLAGVVAASANDAWAVGGYDDDNNNGRTLIEQWDDNSWQVVATLTIPTASITVSAASRQSIPMTCGLWVITTLPRTGP